MAILRKYNVRYVVLGELERQEYGAANIARLEQSLPAVFHAGDAVDPRRVTIHEADFKQ